MKAHETTHSRETRRLTNLIRQTSFNDVVLSLSLSLSLSHSFHRHLLYGWSRQEWVMWDTHLTTC
jgi:hypothetical protein